MSDPALRVGYVETAPGRADIFATSSDLASWNIATGSWVTVVLGKRYFPQRHPRLPSRGANNAGVSCAFPQPEAAALIAAGYATLVGTASPQSGEWTA